MVLKLQTLVLAASLGIGSSSAFAQGDDEATDIKSEEAEDASGESRAPSEEGKTDVAKPSEEEKPAEELPPAASGQPVDEAKASENPAATPAPAAPTEPVRVDDKKSAADRNETKDGVRRAPGVFFGIGYAQVTDIGKYNHYEFFYGQEERMPVFHAGYYLFTKVVDIGIDWSTSYYHAEGNPLTTAEGLTPPLKQNIPGDRAKDPNQKLELTLVPIRLALSAAYTPFYESRRIVLRGYFGMEYLRVEETLSARLSESSSEQGVSKYTLSGWNQGILTGGMVSISLTGIEARSDYALRSMGIDRVYLSPFFEIVTTTNDKMGNYDRKTYGISIDFEGLR